MGLGLLGRGVGDAEFLASCGAQVIVTDKKTEHELAALPECQKSVLTYGLNDFAGLSLASHYDRTFICKSIQQAIARHEPRLKQVAVTLELNEQSTNALYFAIQALLVVHPAEEPVSFDAMLQPSTLQYSVSRARAKL